MVKKRKWKLLRPDTKEKKKLPEKKKKREREKDSWSAWIAWQACLSELLKGIQGNEI